MAIPGQANINIGAENQVAGSDNLYDAFHTIQNNFTQLFETSSPLNTFRAGDGVIISANASNGVVNVNNTGVLSLTAGSGVTVSSANGNVTISAIPTGPAGVTKVGLTSTSLNVTGGNIVSAGTFTVDLPRIATGESFAAGSYVAPNITVDSFGRITEIVAGTSLGTVTSVGIEPGKGISVSGGPIVSNGVISVENTGVTSLQAGSGIQLTGSNGDITISATSSGSGTVTSVGVTSNTLTVTGGPITTTGSINIELSSNIIGNLYHDSNVAAFLPTYTGNLTGNNATLTGNAVVSGSANITGNITANVITANSFVGTFSGSSLTAATVTTAAQPNITSLGTLTTVATTGNANVGANLNVSGNATISGNINVFTSIATFAVAQQGLTVGKDGYLMFSAQNNSGNYVAFLPPTSVPSAGIVWQLPNTIGTVGQVLGTNGSGIMQWKTPPGAGSDTQVQFNDSGTSNGHANLTFNKNTGMLSTQQMTVVASATIGTVKTNNLQYANGTPWSFSSSNVPATASSSGVAGQIAYDASYVYVCVAANTWKRSALTTW